MRRNNKENILSSARGLFLKHGYNGVSLRSIAKEAKLTTGAVYFHFKNKMEIYRTICFEAIDILNKNFRDAITKRNTINQKLISTFDSYIRFYYDNRDYYNILMEYKADYSADGMEGIESISSRMDVMIGIMRDVIGQGISEGAFQKLDPTMLSLFLAAVAEGMLQFKKLGMLEYLKIGDRDFRDFMADVIGRGILPEENWRGDKKPRAVGIDPNIAKPKALQHTLKEESG